MSLLPINSAPIQSIPTPSVIYILNCERSTATHFAVQNNSQSSFSIQASRVHVSSDLKWMEHVDAITSCLYFLKQLRRADVPTTDLLHFYTTVVRPVLEYACPVWHSGLTVAQSDLFRSMQKRAILIVYPTPITCLH